MAPATARDGTRVGAGVGSCVRLSASIAAAVVEESFSMGSYLNTVVPVSTRELVD
jgi:hypothetical protein